MQEKKFRFLDIATADMAFEAFGATLNELFENCALAMEEVMTDTSNVNPEREVSINIKARDLQSLLFDFLSELIYYKDTEGLVFSKFVVEITKGKDVYSLKGKAFGEKWRRTKHEIRTEVKAVTYNQMIIEQLHENGEKWHAQVVLDV